MNKLKWKGLDLDPRKIGESTTVKPDIHIEGRNAFAESSGDGKRALFPRIEAIHAGKTRNNTRYMADKLKGDPILRSGVYSWLHPYPKPIIYNHDTDTKATGRVHNAMFASETKAGRPGIVVIPKITDDEAIQSILDGRLMTVSIGATTDSAICTICDTDIIEEGWCGHMKGESYDGQLCEWIVGNVYFDELSWVNVPADQDAMVVTTGDVIVAEAYAGNDNGIINLGKSSTEWLVTQESAKEKGLLPTKEQKGDLTLPTVEELQAQLTALQTELDEANTAKQGLQDQLDAANQTIAEKDAVIAGKDEELTEKTTQLQAKETELSEANSAKETAEQKVAELNTTIEGLQTERQGLLDKNAELSGEVHKSTAERVVDLKVMLGKVSSREEALEQHVARSSESLKDSLADLLTEGASGAKPRFTPNPVVNPAGGAINDKNEPNASVVIAGKNPVEQKKEVTIEDALTTLLKGPGLIRK